MIPPNALGNENRFSTGLFALGDAALNWAVNRVSIGRALLVSSLLVVSGLTLGGCFGSGSSEGSADHKPTGVDLVEQVSGVGEESSSESGTQSSVTTSKSSQLDAGSVVAGGEQITVYVVGAVKRSGVFKLPGEARVVDAVKRAGGMSKRADRAGLNLAASLTDGQQIVVPAKAKHGSATPHQAMAGSSGAADSTVPTAGGKIDLATATVEQLDTLDGVGPVIAKKIVEFRQKNGGLSSIDQLDQVPGIGEKKLQSLRDQLGG